MVAAKPKTKLVTLKLSPSVLSELPTDFKVPLTSPKKNGASKKTTASSPAPKSPEGSVATPVPTTAATPVPSTASTTSNSGDSKKLDKTGTSSRKWSKKPLVIQSFTGYSITFKSWTGGSKKEGAKEIKKEPITQLKQDFADSTAASPFLDDASSVVSTPDISRVPTPALL